MSSLLYLIKYVRKNAPKIIVLVLCTFLFIPLSFFSFFDFIFEDFDENTIVQTIFSPDQTYRVEVIDNNQGALGGSTLVKVYDNISEIDLYILTISKPPNNIYSGKWGEYKDMVLSWEDQTTLVINGKAYFIGDV